MPKPVTIAITFPDPSYLDDLADTIADGTVGGHDAARPIIALFEEAIKTQSNLDHGDRYNVDPVVYSGTEYDGRWKSVAGLGVAGREALARITLPATATDERPTREQALRHLRMRLVEIIADLDAHVATLAQDGAS